MARIDVKLECGHFVTLSHNSPVLTDGERALCRFDGWQHTKAVYGQQWRVLCMNCRAVYWTLDNERKANWLRNKHMRDRGHEDILVFLDNKVKPKTRAQIIIERGREKRGESDTLWDVSLLPEGSPPPF